MVTDPIADLLTRVRNAGNAGHEKVRVPASRVKRSVLGVLLQEGYIEAFEEVDAAHGAHKDFEVVLRYGNDGSPVIRELSRISRPGRRDYVGVEDIPWFRGGLGTVVISTSQGMLCDRDARSRGIGGELICSVF
jgi:small subunit ribosomal protein S8